MEPLIDVPGTSAGAAAVAAGLLVAARRRAGLSQRELGRRAGTSGPSVAAYEAAARTPRLDTLARLLDACGTALVVSVDPPAAARDLTTRRSLALHAEVRRRLLEDPVAVRAVAERNLARQRLVHAGGRSDRWIDAWQDLLDGPIEVLADLLVDPGQQAVDLRQVTPFAGVVSPQERWAIWRRVREDDRAA